MIRTFTSLETHPLCMAWPAYHYLVIYFHRPKWFKINVTLDLWILIKNLINLYSIRGFTYTICLLANACPWNVSFAYRIAPHSHSIVMLLLLVHRVFDKFIWRTIGTKSFLFGTSQFSIWAIGAVNYDYIVTNSINS